MKFAAVPATRADAAELLRRLDSIERIIRDGQQDLARQIGDLRQGQASIREELGNMMSKKDLAVLRAELKAEVATEVGSVLEFQKERGGLA